MQFAQSGGVVFMQAASPARVLLHLIGSTLELTGVSSTYSGGAIVEARLDARHVSTYNALSATNANITDAGGLIVFDPKATTGNYTGVISDGPSRWKPPPDALLSGSLDKDDSSDRCERRQSHPHPARKPIPA